MQSQSSKAFFIEGYFMNADLFYSPRHRTFIMVYLTPFADNTIYYRYLLADKPILPSYAGGDGDDIVENIFKYKWSNETFLYKATGGPTGRFVYSGGMSLGYFGEDDITHGGSSMLLQWSMPTGANPAKAPSEYQLITARVEWE